MLYAYYTYNRVVRVVIWRRLDNRESFKNVMGWLVHGNQNIFAVEDYLGVIGRIQAKKDGWGMYPRIHTGWGLRWVG